MLRTKAVVSCCIALALLLSMLSGIALWIWPGGLVLGIPRWILTGVHNWTSVAFCAMCILHFLLNWKIFKREFAALRKNKGGRRG